MGRVARARQPAPHQKSLRRAGLDTLGLASIDVRESAAAWLRFQAEWLEPAIAAPSVRELRQLHLVVGRRVFVWQPELPSRTAAEKGGLYDHEQRHA